MRDDFYHTFDELADALAVHRDAIVGDANAGNPRAREIIKWYNANRTDPDVVDGRRVEQCWRVLEEWLESKKESPVVKKNELSEIERGAQTKIAPMAANTLETAKLFKEVEFDDEIYTIAGEWITGTQALRKEIDNTFDEPIAAQKIALDTLRAAKNRYAKPLEEAVDIVKGKMIAFIEIREAEKRAREQQLREDARKKAEEAQRAKASALAAAGKTEAAQALAAKPVMAPAIIDETPAVPKVDGVAIRHEYQYEIVDESLLPRQYLVPDEPKIRKVVAALGEGANIPGVAVKRVANVAAGAR